MSSLQGDEQQFMRTDMRRLLVTAILVIAIMIGVTIALGKFFPIHVTIPFLAR